MNLDKLKEPAWIDLLVELEEGKHKSLLEYQMMESEIRKKDLRSACSHLMNELTRQCMRCHKTEVEINFRSRPP